MPLASFESQTVVADAAAVTGPPPLKFAVEQQGLNDNTPYKNWCWASVAAGVSNFLDSSGVSQCSVATATLKNRHVTDCDCCDSSNQSVCDCIGFLEDALSLNFNLRQHVTSPLPADQIQDEINATPNTDRLPVCMRITWNEGGSHYIGISGANGHADGKIYYTITDPMCGTGCFSDDAMRSAQYIIDPLDGPPLHGTWDETFLLRKSPPA